MLYLDDIVALSSTVEQHLERLKGVLELGGVVGFPFLVFFSVRLFRLISSRLSLATFTCYIIVRIFSFYIDFPYSPYTAPETFFFSVSIHCIISASLLENFDLTGRKIFTSVVLRPHCAVSSCQTSDVCLTHCSAVAHLHLSLTIRQTGQSSSSLLYCTRTLLPSKHTSGRKKWMNT